MAAGALRCVGDQSELRALYGGGWTVTVGLDASAPSAAAAADAALAAALPEAARLPGSFAGCASYHVPAAVSVARIFRTMEALAGRGGSGSGSGSECLGGTAGAEAAEGAGPAFIDWGLSQVGLDEVFRRIVAAAEEEQSPAEETIVAL